MLAREGLGETGESYLVGEDLLMRSDSYHDSAGYSISGSFKNGNRVDTEGVRRALEGEEDVGQITNYLGKEVLSAWNTVDLPGGVRWVMMTEIEISEAFCPKDENGRYYFDDYVEKYGYYDLFLISPNGDVFYTVAKEADYQTNIISGVYSTSGLGNLTREVVSTGRFGFADFEPYAPSNGEPAAFMAQPLVHDGEIEMIIALQLPLEGINFVMSERTGMGETGESYLIGSDMLMRSDSFLDPVNHTVMASFADPSKEA